MHKASEKAVSMILQFMKLNPRTRTHALVIDANYLINLEPQNRSRQVSALFGWLWLVAGADLLSDKSTASWLVADTDLV